jgi:hypothetical protein
VSLRSDTIGGRSKTGTQALYCKVFSLFRALFFLLERKVQKSIIHVISILFHLCMKFEVQTC